MPAGTGSDGNPGPACSFCPIARTRVATRPEQKNVRKTGSEEYLLKEVREAHNGNLGAAHDLDVYGNCTAQCPHVAASWRPMRASLRAWGPSLGAGGPGLQPAYSYPLNNPRVPHLLGLNLALVLREIRLGPKGGILNQPVPKGLIRIYGHRGPRNAPVLRVMGWSVTGITSPALAITDCRF
jgi:hypothetical protein